MTEQQLTFSHHLIRVQHDIDEVGTPPEELIDAGHYRIVQPSGRTPADALAMAELVEKTYAARVKQMDNVTRQHFAEVVKYLKRQGQTPADEVDVDIAERLASSTTNRTPRTDEEMDW